jgi:hypothetical protein
MFVFRRCSVQISGGISAILFFEVLLSLPMTNPGLYFDLDIFSSSSPHHQMTYGLETGSITK